MIYYAIRVIKKIPFLYNLANKIIKRLRKTPVVTDKKMSVHYYGFILKDMQDLAVIKEKYENIKKFDTKLFILINNPSYNILMHRLIRENPDIYFSSFDYFKRYRAKLEADGIIWLDFGDEDYELLDFIA